jgi:hypothetical protein
VFTLIATRTSHSPGALHGQTFPQPRQHHTEESPHAPARHFIVKIEGVEQPVVVLATSHKNVVKALLTVTAASPADLMYAGRADYRLIDTTAPGQADLVEAQKYAQGPGPAIDSAGNPLQPSVQ